MACLIVGGFDGHVMMAGAVKSIPPDPIVLIMLVWDRVVKGVGWQRLVKGGIEDRHLRFAWEQVRGHANAERVSGIMERR